LGIIKRDEFLDPELLYTKAIFCVVQYVYTLITLVPTAIIFKTYYFRFISEET